MHVGHVLCKQCAVPPPADFDLRIFTCFSYRLSWIRRIQVPIGRQLKNRSTTVRTICHNNDLLRREISPRTKSVKTALNACVVIFGKAQTDEDGIIRCAVEICNFSMWNNATQYSYQELHGPKVRVPTRNRSFLVVTSQRTSVTAYNLYSFDPAKPVGETSKNTTVKIGGSGTAHCLHRACLTCTAVIWRLSLTPITPLALYLAISVFRYNMVQIYFQFCPNSMSALQEFHPS